EFARAVIATHNLAARAAAVLLSPVHGVLDPRTLSEWMLADRLPARLQVQLHKFIWHPSTRGVEVRAVVLLSGGLDSYTARAIARAQFSLCALTFAYGQRHAREVTSARAVARALGVERHLELDIDLRAIGGSSLTSADAVPHGRDVGAPGIPSTYVPARNTIFLSIALGWAETLDARDIVIGVNALDYSGYPDCRPDFIAAFERVANLGTRAGAEGGRFRVHTPP